MIKYIVFDMGNVLLRFSPKTILETFFETDEDRAIILKEVFNSPFWVMIDSGRLTCDDLFDKVKDNVPSRLHERLIDCCKNWHITMTELDGAKDFISYVKSKGYKTYILSNAGIEFYTYFPRVYNLSDFDGYVISCDVHVTKPDKAIYNSLIEKYSLIPNECLFIDDVEKNVNGAINCGMNAEIHTGNFEIIKEKYSL